MRFPFCPLEKKRDIPLYSSSNARHPLKESLFMIKWERYKHSIGIWCNGSTPDFESVDLGSNPGIPALYEAENLINLISLPPVSAGDLLFLLI
jgi:hypothetical protein